MRERVVPRQEQDAMKVIGYVRVSSQEQIEGYSLEGQASQIRDACRQRGWELAQVIADEGYSAKSLERPGIREALGLLKRGEAKGLIAAKLDRLSRDMHDFTGLLKQAQKEGWALVCLDLNVDTSSVTGEVMANIVGVFAQFERKRIGERTAEGIRRYREANPDAGWGGPVVGADLVERIRDERQKGKTLQAIASGLNAEGIATARGGKWWPSTIKAVL